MHNLDFHKPLQCGCKYTNLFLIDHKESEKKLHITHIFPKFSVFCFVVDCLKRS